MGTKNRFKLSSVVYTMSCVSPGRSSPRLCCLSRAVFVCLFLSFHRSCSEICCHVTPEFLCSRTVQYIITEPLFFRSCKQFRHLQTASFVQKHLHWCLFANCQRHDYVRSFEEACCRAVISLHLYPFGLRVPD